MAETQKSGERRPKLTTRQWIGYIGFAIVFLFTAAVAGWHGDVLRAGLNPRVPFQTYEPPPAPDYADADAWILRESRQPGTHEAAVFFVHPTTFDGGDDWNAPIDDAKADAYLKRYVLTNYAGPFQRVGAVSAPRYRQASLYTRMTIRDDAREAQVFPYRDIEAAFEAWLASHPDGPLVLAGVEQGGDLLDELLRRRIAPDAALKSRIVAVYLIDAVVAADNLGLPACERPDQIGCVVGWVQAREGDDDMLQRRLSRTYVWGPRDRLYEIDDRPILCVNPILGTDSTAPAPARLHAGATNATGLEWGVRPALTTRAVSAQCRDGILRHSAPGGESFRNRGSWADRRKIPQYNLFYADLELDAERRLAAWAT